MNYLSEPDRDSNNYESAIKKLTSLEGNRGWLYVGKKDTDNEEFAKRPVIDIKIRNNKLYNDNFNKLPIKNDIVQLNGIADRRIYSNYYSKKSVGIMRATSKYLVTAIKNDQEAVYVQIIF